MLPELSPPAADTLFGETSFGRRTARAAAAALGRIVRWAVASAEFACAVGVGALVAYELETSPIQARLFSTYAQRLTFELRSGPSSRIAYPRGGPFDERRGYTEIPRFRSRLEERGFRVTAQSEMSPELAQLVAAGISPPFDEEPAVGLEIRSRTGTLVYRGMPRERLFTSFEDIPPLLVRSLLYMENRELLAPTHPSANPAVEWDRFARASLTTLGRMLGLSLRPEGGSTLAVQLEKYRHSPHGRTGSVAEKFRQIVGASLKAYRTGEDTTGWRRRILLDYLNTLPLAAAPGYGELYGLGDGLYSWFGLELDDVLETLRDPEPTPARAFALKHVLALLAATRAPTHYLRKHREALEARVDWLLHALREEGILDPELAEAALRVRLRFLPRAPVSPRPSFVQQKAVNAIRVSLLELLGVPSLYELDRLHLTAHSTIDVALQEELAEFLRKFRDPEFVKAHGLDAKHLLEGADPREVVYSILLYEATPRGNLLRAQADNLDRPFDVNDGIKMELGSTAKLRTLAHYLEIMAELHTHLSRLDPISLREKRRTARDRLTRWAAEYLEVHPNALLREFLDAALERRYSASPYESFFTGGGVHAFRNFDRDDNRRILSVRQAFLKSTNLVFIRLMRDLVAYHKARLPYDAEAVLRDPSNPLRRKMLDDIVEEESRETLRRFYVRYRDLEGDAVVEKLLRGRIDGRSTAVLFHAWRLGEHGWTLDRWFDRWKVRPTPRERRAFETTYARFTLADYGYLLGRHPLEVWVAGERYTRGHVEWKELLLRSARARREAYAWIYKTRNRSAQNRRLRTKIEGDAFERMTPYWRRLGFPFRRLVPSYATAIGSSSDRPSGLAELMGIIVNDGSRKPSLRLTRLRFAEGTPYETVLEPVRRSERVLHPTVARVLREMLRDVVEAGTARRLAGALRTADGITVPLGGKTGSGDNRLKKVNRWGGEIRSRALNRTAAFVFYAGDRYFGVVTAFVEGKKAERYSFTSALPVTVLKLASPILAKHLDLAAPRPGRETENEAKGPARAEGDRGASLPFRPSSGT